EAWCRGMQRLAQLPNVSVKLSGLALALQSVAADRLRPWIETAIESFGTERAFFSSNFPVDGVFGSFAELYGSYREITAAMTSAEVHALFVGNAARVYQLHI
ncbi:MAG: amidohydrolase family protein, partial [bacterium]|nr:amidohydrolase family protein [bacterium]